MFLRRLFSGTSITLTLVSIGTLLASCSDDNSNGGCAGACGHSWSLCKDDLTASGQQESGFTNGCLDACRSAASTDARALGQSLNCATQAKECDSARQCPTFGPLLGSSGNGGFAGFGGSAGFAGFGANGNGGFPQCTNFTSSSCTCFDGSLGTRQCQSGFWGSCTCFGSGGSGGGGGQCSDICFYSNNGLCDDGGPTSSTSRCSYGTDCSDCGTRFGTGAGGSGGFGGLGAGGGTAGCSNSCTFAFNNECDDGGPNSIQSICALGTDCYDCGTRFGTGGSVSDSGAGGTSGAGGSAGAGGAGVDGGSAFCSDGCVYHGDTVCDDGGPNATSARCSYGTDCADCGTRPFASNGAAGSPAILCSNTCGAANNGICNDDGVTCTFGTDCNDCLSRNNTGGYLCTDACGRTNGVCDDGGFSSSTSLCAIGTDCSDCGPR